MLIISTPLRGKFSVSSRAARHPAPNEGAGDLVSDHLSDLENILLSGWLRNICKVRLTLTAMDRAWLAEMQGTELWLLNSYENRALTHLLVQKLLSVSCQSSPWSHLHDSFILFPASIFSPPPLHHCWQVYWPPHRFLPSCTHLGPTICCQSFLYKYSNILPFCSIPRPFTLGLDYYSLLFLGFSSASYLPSVYYKPCGFPPCSSDHIATQFRSFCPFISGSCLWCSHEGPHQTPLFLSSQFQLQFSRLPPVLGLPSSFPRGEQLTSFRSLQESDLHSEAISLCNPKKVAGQPPAAQHGQSGGCLGKRLFLHMSPGCSGFKQCSHISTLVSPYWMGLI